MPELPEVETIRRQLQRSVVGKKISAVRVIFGKKINVSADHFARVVAGTVIKGVGRRAKLLLVHLGNGWTMVIHLKMTGRVLFQKAGTPPGKHAFIILTLAGGRQIAWEDMRKFGFLKLVRTAEIENLWKKEGYGPEPLAPSFTPEILKACLRRHAGKKIKQLLLEQTCVAGLGNIYAVETLWSAGVHPHRAAGKVTDSEIKKMHAEMRKILRSAVAARGSSADDYLDLFGREGTFVPKLRVYDRRGKNCLRRDGGVIAKVRTGGRGTYFCPKCQH